MHQHTATGCEPTPVPSSMSGRPLRRGAPAALLLALAALSAPAGAAGLGEILQMAQDSDATYAAARHAASAGRERSVQGRAGLLPTVGITGRGGRNHETSSTYSGTRNYNQGSLTLQLSQPVMRRANWETYLQGELQAELAEHQLQLARQELLLRVARGYFDVLQAQDSLATVGAQKDAFAQQLAQAKRGYEVGTAPVTDLNEAQSRYDLTLAQEIAARNELEVKRRTLEKSIAREVPPLARLDPLASVAILPEAQQQELLARAPEEALPVRIGLIAQQIAEREIGKQQAGHLPTVDLVASVGEVRNNNYPIIGNNVQRQAIIGVELAIPLYQGGAVSSRMREAVANRDRAREELVEARREAQLAARQALLGVQSGTALTQSLMQAQSSGETQVRSTRRGLEVGVRTRVDVLNAEQQLFATRRDLSAARYQTLVSGLQLKAAAGALTEQDVLALQALLKE